MFKKLQLSAVLLCLLCTCFVHVAQSSAVPKSKEGKNAIVIASFGTTVPEALPAITNILKQVREAYPQTEVRLCFTSNIIRNIWHKRQAEPEKWLKLGVPQEVLFVKNIISVLGDLHEEGYRNVIVQPTHMFFMEQSHDLASYVHAINSINTLKEKWKPFDHVVMGRPALGMPGDNHDYHQDVVHAVKTLAADVAIAEQEKAALVYMGHGNEHWSTGIYAETAHAMKTEYPQVKTVIGVVEGQPTIEHVVAQLKQLGCKKVVLKPFMIVAGDHATNDMAGAAKDSWQSILEANGIEVKPVLTGLGSNQAFVQLFVEHIADAAKINNLQLK